MISEAKESRIQVDFGKQGAKARSGFGWHKEAIQSIFFSFFYLLNTSLMERMNKATLLQEILPGA